MDRTVVKFRHCGKDLYTFSDQRNQAGSRTALCPACQQSLALGLLDAPVALPCPFTNGHKAPCSFLLGANDGPSSLGEWLDSELHVGVSNSAGLVYNYTLSGVQRDEHGWEQCVCIPLVPPWRDSLIDSWDKELQTFSSLPTWAAERFQEEREFGSCCYGFALTFINHMRSLDGKDSLSRNDFTTVHVLPRVKRASMYIKVYGEILQNGFYMIDK
ncbi:MKRN2 opposite strand, tandem duplicate 1 isoform X2 [Salminus brasiliensis]|uniref:MKRN2 opposite strand, tandem duplicate 1 isoform X2 n=1 Tax=Salminus brasiliensis TaxID=930266 RepID=UPI003B82F856